MMRSEMEQDILKVLVTEEELKARVAEMGEELYEKFQGKKPLFLGVLKGSFVFMTDLVRACQLKSDVEFIAVSSYGNATASSGRVQIDHDLRQDITGRHLIIVEDILDSGNTLYYLMDVLRARKPASIRICTLMDKPERRTKPITADYVGFVIPDAFIVGYGLDAPYALLSSAISMVGGHGAAAAYGSTFEEMGFAKLDMQRELRTGFQEVVYCAGKPDSYLISIFLTLYEKNGEVFGTRATPAQYELVRQSLPQIEYDAVSRILKMEQNPAEKAAKRIGSVVVCTAGTADIPVAEEAAQTAEYFGTAVTRIYDVGVSGLHRLLANTETIQQANCVVAVAGMEGALASVVGGLVSNPVIAVPTSVGYGASLHGLSALLTMINSCANGIAVVNIDNGYGAGYLATQINRLAEKHL